MRSGLILLAGIAGLAVVAMTCPEQVRTEVAERASVPPEIYAEAERQFDTFVDWARDPADRPDDNHFSENGLGQ